MCVVRISKQDKCVRSKQDRGWSGRVQEEDGRRTLGWRLGQNGVIAVGMETANDLGSGRFIDPQTLAAESDATVGFDARGGALARDVRPPRTAWSWA